jgi:hypothetical protein
MFPKLYETNNAFPKNADWHVYDNDSSCCVDVPPNEIIICKGGLNVIDYIQKYAIPYLANQTYRIREGHYLYGEYSHDILGRIEFYQSKLKAKSLMQLCQMFALILKGYNLDRREMCPFCYKEKFRKCHRDAFKELQLVKTWLVNDGLILEKILKEQPDFKLPSM